MRLPAFYDMADKNMIDDIFTHMQQAVDIVGSSEHLSNKIAATISCRDAEGLPFSLSYNNYWPETIKTKIGRDVKIGNSSGTIHAETACLLHAPVTDQASMFVTDPPCPNCVKNMAEAGIRTLYIDHKGFDKDFAARRGHDFRTLSMEICAKAGINVFKLFRKEQRTESISHATPGYMPVIEKRARVEMLKKTASNDMFSALVKQENAFYKSRPFALALAEGQLGSVFMISAEIHAVAGFTSKNTQTEGKYDLLLQPVHRILMTAARYGLKIKNEYIFCSRVPTAREMVNMIGANLNKIHIGNDETARDEFGLSALKQLEQAGILQTLSLLT
jgi:deoxycytidylate deaminase